MNTNKKNKKAFLADIKGLINPDGANSLVQIDKSVIVELLQKDIITSLSMDGTLNQWYRINGAVKGEMLLLEVVPDNYKIVEGGEKGSVLQQFHWWYDGKNVSTSNVMKGKSIPIEKVLLNLSRNTFFNPNDLNWDAHHMYLRSVALLGALKALNHVDHVYGHKIVGNYNRGQNIQIDTSSEFIYFITVVIKYINILKTKKFSIEY